MSKYKIDKEDSMLMVIDYQEKLLPAMSEPKALESTVIKLIKGIKALNVPVLVTQQYTKGLGSTTGPVADALGDFTHYEKSTFNALDEEEVIKALEASGKKTVIICGIEAHICVQQTAIDLMDRGYKVAVVADCIASREERNCLCSIDRMRQAGALVTTYEAVLYELLKSSRAEGFKEISRIVK